MNDKNQTVAISTSSILKILSILLGLVFLYVVRNVLVVVFVSLVLAAAMNPTITKLQRRGIPRWVGIAVIYVGIFGVLALLAALVVPLVTDELGQLINAVPTLYGKVFSAVQGSNISDTIQQALGSLNDALSKVTTGVFSGVASFFGGLFALIGTLVLTFYLTIQDRGIKSIAVDLAPARQRPYLTRLFNRIEDRLGQWLRGQLTLGLVIATLTYLALFLLNVKYALVLALLAGVTELIPIVGPYIGAVPAVIVAFSQDPWLALWTIVAYVVIQQLENHLIVPRVMGRVSGLNPVIVIVSVLVGGKLGGILGVLLAVPSVIIVTSFLEDFLEEHRQENSRLASPNQS